jgi:hypothetical protein
MRNARAELGITIDSTALPTVPISPVLHANLGVTGIAEAALELDINAGSGITLNSTALTTVPISPVLPANSGVTSIVEAALARDIDTGSNVESTTIEV